MTYAAIIYHLLGGKIVN